MLPFAKRVFIKIIILMVKPWKQYDNSKRSKYSKCRQNDNENTGSKN